MSINPDLGSFSPGFYSPADFPDAHDITPNAVVFDMGGHGLSTPYSTAVNAIVHKHMDEIQGQARNAVNMPINWKKRLRDFLSLKNTELLDFLKLSVKSHETLSTGDTLLRRFGNPDVGPNHPTVREFVLDVSGEDVLEDLNRLLGAENALKKHAGQTAIIYDEYRKAGDQILQEQNILKGKLDKFDKIQSRVVQLFDIESNENYDALMAASEAYLKSIFDENAIEQSYTRLIQAYRRFAYLRDVVSTSRSLLSQESEPICSICLDESVSYALVPCGHTLCQTCMRRQNGLCFMCRVPIRDKMKLFF
jgi:hypothetical protein